MDEFMNMVNTWVGEYAPIIAGVIIFLIVAMIVSSWIGRKAGDLLAKARMEKTLARFLGRTAGWAVFVLALLGCLNVFNVQTTSFAAIIGASALAIGLAFQGSLSNIAAGVMLLTFRPFKVGDVVEIAGELGKVEELELFTTQLNTPDNRRIILPNSQVFGAVIENITANPTRRVDVPVGVEYSADLDKTREVLTASVEGLEKVLQDPPPQIILLELGDSSVNWQVRVWTQTANYWDVKDATVRAVKQALDAAGLGIPFPQMDVHLDKLEA